MGGRNGFGTVPCVHPQSFSWHPFLLSRFVFCPLCPFMACSPHFSWRTVALSHFLQPDSASGVRGIMLCGGHLHPSQSLLQEEGYELTRRSRELTLVSMPWPPPPLLPLTACFAVERGTEECLAWAAAPWHGRRHAWRTSLHQPVLCSSSCLVAP